MRGIVEDKIRKRFQYHFEEDEKILIAKELSKEEDGDCLIVTSQRLVKIEQAQDDHSFRDIDFEDIRRVDVEKADRPWDRYDILRYATGILLILGGIYFVFWAIAWEEPWPLFFAIPLFLGYFIIPQSSYCQITLRNDEIFVLNTWNMGNAKTMMDLINKHRNKVKESSTKDTLKCSSCGEPNQNTNQFCLSCGFALSISKDKENKELVSKT